MTASPISRMGTSVEDGWRESSRTRRRAPAPRRTSNAFYAARCVACHGVRSHPVPVVLVGECSIPVVWKVAH